MNALLPAMDWLNQVDSLIPRVGWTLVHSMWEGVLIAALLAMLLRAMRTAPATIRYVACCSALLAVIATMSITFAMLRPREIVQVQPLARPAPALASGFAEVPIPRTPLRSLAVSQSVDLLRIVVLAWLLGVALMTLRHICGWFWLQNLRRGSRSTEFETVIKRLSDGMRIARLIQVIETAKIDVPAVIGVFRPVILVPVGVFSGLSPQQIDAILAHELAHIRRHDYLVNLLQAAVESLMFYHPAVWWISRRIRAEREHCCDDIAAEVCGSRAEYAGALATLESRRSLMAFAPAATGGELLARVRRILRLPAPTRQNKVRSLAAAVLALACMSVPLLLNAQAKPASQQSAITRKSPATTQRHEPMPPEPKDFEQNPAAADGTGKTTFVIMGSHAGQYNVPRPNVRLLEAFELARVQRADCYQLFVLRKADGRVVRPQNDKLFARDPGQNIVIREGDKIYIFPPPTSQPAAAAMPAAKLSVTGFDVPATLKNSTTSPTTRNFDIAVGFQPSYVVLAQSPIAGSDQKLLTISGATLQFHGVEGISVSTTQKVAPSTQPQLKFMKIAIGKSQILRDGQHTHWTAVKRMLDAIPPAERKQIVLQIAAFPDVTVKSFNEDRWYANHIVEMYGLAYLSDTGIVETPEPPVTREQRRLDAVQQIEDMQAQRKKIASTTKDKALLEEIDRRIELIRSMEALEDPPSTPPAATKPATTAPSTQVGKVPAAVTLLAELIRKRDVYRDTLAQMSSMGPKNPRKMQIQQLHDMIEKKIAEQISVESIGAMDPTMREYLRTRDSMEFRLQQRRRNLGENNPVISDAKADLELQNKRIEAYSQAFRKSFGLGPAAPVLESSSSQPAATKPAD